jgi:replicative DNA helicase
MRLLSAVMNDPTIVDRPDVVPELFVHKNARAVFNTIRELKDSGIPITRDAVIQGAKDRDLTLTTEFVDGILSSDVPPSIDDVLKKLRDSKRVVDLKNRFDEVVRKIDTSTDESYLESVSETLYQMAESMKSTDTKKVYDFDTLLTEYETELNLRASGKKYKFNFQVLDELIPSGPTPGNGGIVVASSGMGKCLGPDVEITIRVPDEVARFLES